MNDQESSGTGEGKPLNTEGEIAPPSPPKPPSFLHRALFNSSGLRSGWRLLIFAAIWLLGLILFGALGGVLTHRFRQGARSLTPNSAVVIEGFFFISVLIAAFVMARCEKKSFADYLLPWHSAFRGKFWLGVLWGWVALTALLLAIRLDHGFSFGHVALARSKLPYDAAVWALTFLLTGFFEEFSFRGYPLYILTKGIGFWPAAVILSAAFGAIHLSNIGEDWAGALCAAIIGVFFCFTVRRTGSLWFAIGLHAMWDYAETFLYSVPNSGLKATGHLLDSSFHGPVWLTGGSVGPEGSALVFVLIGILFLVFHLLYPEVKFSGPADRV